MASLHNKVLKKQEKFIKETTATKKLYITLKLHTPNVQDIFTYHQNESNILYIVKLIETKANHVKLYYT